MKSYWSGLVAAGAMAATVTIGAQQGPANPANTPPPDAAAQPGAQRTPPAPSAEARTPNTITVSGCLQSAPATATAETRGPAGAGASAAAGPAFMLSGVTSTAAGDTKGGAVGTTGTAATSYKLEGDAKQLSPHLNHRVEIMGRVQSSSASATGAERAAPGSTAAGPTLRVESVKMLSSTCDAAAASPSPTQQKPQTAPNTQKP